jgi:hypothetical protein
MAGLGQFLVTTGKLCLQRAAKSDTHFANTVFGVFIGIVFTSLVVVGAWPRALDAVYKVLTNQTIMLSYTSAGGLVALDKGLDKYTQHNEVVLPLLAAATTKLKNANKNQGLPMIEADRKD